MQPENRPAGRGAGGFAGDQTAAWTRSYDKITPEGTRDLLFEECEAVKRVEQALGAVFTGRGYHEVVTPGIEFLDVFNKPSSHFPQETMYKLVDAKGRLLVMRPDSTLPIARLVGTRLKNAALPLRLFYNQPVYRAAARMNGRSDELIQTGIELIGCGSQRADLEVLATAAAAFDGCGIDRYRLEIGHVGVFRALFDALDADESQRAAVRQLLQNRSYPALNDLLDSLDDPTARLLRRLPRLFGGAEVLQEAAELFHGQDGIMELIGYLGRLYEDLVSLVGADRLLIDLGLVNHNDYYTGIVFSGYLEGRGEAVLSGGRYDRLLGDFGAELDAIGFGVDVDAVARHLLDRVTLAPPRLLVHGLDGCLPQAIRFAEEQIAAGQVCELSVFDAPDEAVRYARGKGIERIVLVGHTTESVLLLGEEAPE